MRSPRSRLRAFCACAGLALAAAPGAGARPAPPPQVPADPALQSGVLPNGLRYFLLPRRTEPDHVSVRLIVEAGSLDEHEDERGYAHFVEHMAFAGTVHYPAGKLVLFLQGLGLGLGADLNADTSFTHTIYKLNLPASRHLPQALEVLRDYADGLTFPEYAVERQRGVVLSELRARATAQYDFSTQMLSFLYAGTPLPERMPIGDAGLIAQADATRLRAFYRRCYRPERMIVLVVGDIDPAAVAPLLRQQFATLAPAPGRPVPPAPLVVPSRAEIQADTLTAPAQSSAAVDLITLVPHPLDTVADLRVSEADAVVLSLLNRRLAERAAADPRIGRAFATAEAGADQRYTHFHLEAQTASENWPLAVNLLEGELRRARQQGFQPEEIEEAVSALFANLVGARDEVATYRPSVLADAVAARLALGLTWHDLGAEVRLSSEILAHFTPADAAAALGPLFPEAGLHLLAARPTPLPGGREALLAAYRSSSERALGSGLPVAEGLPLFHYGDLLPAGSVARRVVQPDLRVTSLLFANGVRVNLRPSLGESHRFGLSLRLGQGLADTPRAEPRLEMLALAFLSASDLGKNSKEEIGRLLRLHAIAFSATSDDNQTFLNATAPSAELPFTLRFLTALLTDLEMNPARLNRALAQYAAMQRHESSSTLGWAKNEILYQLANEDPRLRLSSPQEIGRYSFADLTAWMGRHWLTGPIEVGIVGDLEPNAAADALSRTLGALPPRQPAPDLPGARLAFRPTAYRRTETEPLPDEAAALRVAWPAAEAGTVAEQAALQLAVDVVVDRLRLKVREDLGATYAPAGGFYQYAPQPDFRFAWIELTFDPKQANTLGLLTLNLSDELARKGVTAEEFSRLREPRRTQTAAQLGSDDWWLHQVLVRAQSQPQVLDETRALVTAYSQVTREDVNRAAARFLRVGNATAILVIPASTTAAPKAP